MDHILIEEYLNKQFLIGNKITLNEYYKGLDTDNYKYVVYLKDNENIKEIDQLNIEYQENSYNYYQNIKVISDKIDECIIYLMMFVIVSYIYYMIKIIYKKMVYKENEINFLLSINMTKKKIANLINKENFVIHLTAFITSFVSSFWIINIVFQTVRVDYKTCFIYLVISKLFNDYLCMCLLNKKVKI